MARRKSLGRGLDALLSGTARSGAAAQQAGAPVADRLEELPVDLLARGRYQPRVDIREESLADLAGSIRRQGVVQPIVVRPLPRAEGGEQRYEIVAGERRWRAAQLAGLDTIPAIVREIPDEAAVAVSLIENIQREDLNTMEEARALMRLVTEFELTHAEAAEAVGRSRAAVSNLLRLLDLPAEIHAMLERRELDMGHGRTLLGVEGADKAVALAKQVVAGGWSVRETERAVRRLAAGGSGGARKNRSKSTDPNIVALENRLSEKLGAPVSIDHRPKGGRIVIRYHSLDELDGILERIE